MCYVVIKVRRDYVLVFGHSIRLFFNGSGTGITQTDTEWYRTPLLMFEASGDGLA
jgi:hypothetical protein